MAHWTGDTTLYIGVSLDCLRRCEGHMYVRCAQLRTMYTSVILEGPHVARGHVTCVYCCVLSRLLMSVCVEMPFLDQMLVGRAPA